MKAFVEAEVVEHLKTCKDEACEHYEFPHPAPGDMWSMCPECDTECAPRHNPCRCCGGQA